MEHRQYYDKKSYSRDNYGRKRSRSRSPRASSSRNTEKTDTYDKRKEYQNNRKEYHNSRKVYENNSRNKYKPSRSYYDDRSVKKRRISNESSSRQIKELKQMPEIKREMRNFLNEQANIKETDDFWTFFEKYQMIQVQRGNSSDFDKKSLLYFDFDTHIGALHDKLPTLDKDGEKLEVNFEVFKDFMCIVRIYEDFQQKTKFAKLKKLREAQNDLPMAQFKKELIEVLQTKRVVLVAGDTGCGKSTQVPQYVLEAGYKKIVCTQPRRIACVSLAKRVAYETLNNFKDIVGYQIRFEKSKKADTRIIFMTEGLLLRHASDEETLNTYDVIILDEVHERHLHGDFLIGIMKCLLHKRKDFKLILMSATINIDLFKNYFAGEDLHVIEVPGRLYPIEIKYLPIIKDPYERKQDRFDSAPYLRIIEMIDKNYTPVQKGDLLIFLNGFSEISTLADAVNEYANLHKNWIVLILHSSLSLEEQDKVFDYPPSGVRKCIISTNIAETSVTIDGIRFVVDSGKVNRMSYVTKGGINKLTEVVISQDSAKQRAGRAGRTGPGICYRLYSEEDFKNFESFTPAEIHLVPLDSLFLHMISMGLRDLSNFPFLEKPDDTSVGQAIEKLKFMGALRLNEDYLQLTPLGESLSRLPVDLTIGKMLIMSTVFENVNSVLVLAALLSVQSPITQQAQRNHKISELLRSLESNHGDPISLLNYYKEWLEVKQNCTVSNDRHNNRNYKTESSKTWARKHGLEEQRFYEVTKLFSQFRDILIDAELLPKLPEKSLTKGERSIRHGELKQLKSMRWALRNESRSSKRKQLKFDLESLENDNEKTDLRDVEFRILNDSNTVQKILKETSLESYKNLMLLKLILTCGLYPQFSVEDEFNSSKTVSEKLYHTKDKHYVFLRPFSYFALNSETLELGNDDIETPPPGYFSKRPLSRKHQILVYQSILETKKVYLVNTMRMPTLQTLLLFSKTIATNSTLTKFAFDDFLLVHVPFFGQGKTLLLKALALCQTWQQNLEKRLLNPGLKTDEEAIFNFKENLLKYMQSEVVYNVKRLLPADLKIIYNGHSQFCDVSTATNVKQVNPFDQSYSISQNTHIGGLQVSENLVYNCLVQEEWEYQIEEQISSEPFQCPVCRESKLGHNFLEMLQHETECRRAKEDLQKITSTAGGSNTDTPNVIKPNARVFHCTKCLKDLSLTPVEILKHKKTCS